MWLLQRVRSSIRICFLLTGSGLLMLWGMQRPAPPHLVSNTGLMGLTDTLFTLGLWVYLVLLGTALGRWSLRQVGLRWATPDEALLWEMPTGLALLGYPVHGLGLLGLLRPPWIAALLLGMTIWLQHDLQSAAGEFAKAVHRIWIHVARLPRAAKWAMGMMAALLGSSLLHAITPPTAYDALWYHLQAPRLFLQAGRIYPEFDNWPANYAFALNMMYAIPMALGSDVVPQLAHWAFGVALLGMVYSIARPAAGSFAWIAPAFVLTMPAFLFPLATEALTDVAAACLEVMALAGLMRATARRDKRWLIAAGIWAGLAVGTKFASLPVLVVGVGLWTWRGGSIDGVKRAKGLLYFLLPALMLATPWYLKNAIWFGTPFFPAGMQSADPEVEFRNRLSYEYIQQARIQGLCRLRFFYWLLAAPNRLDYVSPPLALPFMVLLFISPFSLHGLARDALILGGIRALLWIIGPPGIRFLISVFALWGIAASAVTAQGWTDPRLQRRVVAQVLAGSHWMFIAVLLLIVGIATIFAHPMSVALGMESRADYLRRTLEGYRGLEYVRDHLGPDDRVLLIGDARHYYCPSRCYPEADHFTWPRIVWAANFDVQEVSRRLGAMGITHLWIHRGSITWLLDHDPGGWMRRSYDFLRTQFAPLCARRIYADDDVEILRVTCNSRTDR